MAALASTVNSPRFSMVWYDRHSLARCRQAEGVGRTSVNATVACAATVGQWLVGRKFDGDKQFAEEELAARVGDNELLVLAYPSQSGSDGPITLQHGSRVDESAIIGNANGGGKLAQLLLHDVVIIES